MRRDGRPLEVRLVRLRHVRGGRSCSRPRCALRAWAATRWPRVEDLDASSRVSRTSTRFVHERVRHRVVVVVDLDVVVDVDARVLPLGVREGLGRQRPERRPVEALEELAAARAAVVAHRLRVELVEQLGDARVQRGEREEGLVAQPREDPALGDLHGDLDLGLVARLRRARRQDRRPVVRRRAPRSVRWTPGS